MVIECRMDDGGLVSKDSRRAGGVINRASASFVHHLLCIRKKYAYDRFFL